MPHDVTTLSETEYFYVASLWLTKRIVNHLNLLGFITFEEDIELRSLVIMGMGSLRIFVVRRNQLLNFLSLGGFVSMN